MAGQRAGKSNCIGVRSANYVRYFPKIIGMIAANTYLQLTQSTMVEVRRVWKDRFDITEYDKNGNPNGVYVVGKQPPLHFTRHHEFDDYRGIVSFRNGAVIFTASLDNYMAHDGKTIGWAELDETKDTKREAVKNVILARLSQKGMYYHNTTGNVIYTESTPSSEYIAYNPCVINTSPAEGTVDWLEEMFGLNAEGVDMEILSAVTTPGSYYHKITPSLGVIIWSTHWNEVNLPANYIENRKKQLTEGEQLKFIYGYPFSKTGNEYYNEYSRTQHVKKVLFEPSLPVHLTYDFNLHPYMTLLCFQVIDTPNEMIFRFFDEYCYEDPRNTTEAVTMGFVEDYGTQVRDVYYYGDAMGTRGIEGFGSDVTRFDDVRKVLFMFVTDDSDRTMRYNYGVNKRRNLINKIYAGKFYIGHRKVSIEIDPKCKHLILDCQYLKTGTNGKKKEVVEDKAKGISYEKYGHTSDAKEYGVCWILSDYL